MRLNNNLSILHFYENIEEQLYRKEYAYGEVYPIIMPYGKLLPFQIVRQKQSSNNNIVYATINDINDISHFYNITDDLLSELTSTDYASKNINILKYPAFNNLVTNIPKEGLYYMRLYDGGHTYYSEVFSVSKHTHKMIKIEYWDSENLEMPDSIVDYSDGFKHIVYINSKIGKPEYEFEEEVTKRDGYSFIEKQISEKTYKFTFLATEALCDAMRIIRMCDNIKIYSYRTDYEKMEYDVETFLITPKWEDDGYLASVEAEFQCDTVIKKISAKYEDIDDDTVDDSVKMYAGLLPDEDPDELDIKALQSFAAVKQVITVSYESVQLGDRKCFAYPASFGNLVSCYVFEGWELISTLRKTEKNFTFNGMLVPMFIYTSINPVTYVTTEMFEDFDITMTFKF